MNEADTNRLNRLQELIDAGDVDIAKGTDIRARLDQSGAQPRRPGDKPADHERVWIIQRCTQKWIGSELQYQDWGKYGPATMTPVSRPEMIETLHAVQRRWPDDEFRGHNIAACRCHQGVAVSGGAES